MSNILSIITFIPAVAAAILALFLRGNDAAAQRNAKWLALLATIATFLVSLLLLTGCGQKGPLTLPKDPPPAAEPAPAKPATSQPVQSDQQG